MTWHQGEPEGMFVGISLSLLNGGISLLMTSLMSLEA